MLYRTRTYIAGDWAGDKDAIEKLYSWKNSDFYNLYFVDAHEYHQSNDNSLNCSIKNNLRIRMNGSKKFVLIVGNKTNNVTAGSCIHCEYYNSFNGICRKNLSVSKKSYIQYECDKAVKDKMEIIVLYNYSYIAYLKCPDVLKNVGKHVAMRRKDGTWDYNAVKNALS